MALTRTLDRIEMKHGAGGRSMRALIEDVLVDRTSVISAALDDGAAIPIGRGQWLIVTTDSHVIHPLVFPGGDIGRLSVCGAVNDLAMMGATEPLALTCGLVIEEGFSLDDLRRLHRSMTETAAEAGAAIVTGDTKVMGRGEIDGLVINTTGVAITDVVVSDSGLRPGDRLIVTGTIGDHGVAVMAARHQLDPEGTLVSDVAPLNGLVRAALAAGGRCISAMKDPTRGGVASALHDMAAKGDVGIVINEIAVPVRREVRAAAEILGIDPLLVANGGKAIIGVRPDAAAAVLEAIRAHPFGRDAAIVGACTSDMPGSVVLETGFGRRLLVESDGELQPRIC